MKTAKVLFGGQTATLVEGELSPLGAPIYEVNGRRFEACICLGVMDDQGGAVADENLWVGLRPITKRTSE